MFRWAAVCLLLGGALPALAQGLRDEDPGEYQAVEPKPIHRAFLPDAVDLSGRFPRPGDQGNQGSCVGWAVGYAARSYYAQAREGSPPNPAGVVSPAYIYNSIRDPGGDCDSGSSISDALKLLQRGAVSLAEYPYDERSCSRPPASIAGQATRFRITGYGRFRDHRRLDDVKGELAKGNPVIFGARYSADFHKLKGGIYRGGGVEDDGGHATTLVGYDDRRQAFKLINSWGPSWGQGGFGWIAYDTWAARTKYAYVMDLGEAPAPAPRPPPAPPPVAVRPPPAPIPGPVAVVPPPVPAPAPAPVPVPVAPVPVPPAARADPPLENYACADLSLGRQGGRRRIAGFVASQADLATLNADVAGQDIALDVRVHAWPQCEALLTFKAARTAAGGPKVSLRGGRTALAEGEPLVIEVTAPGYPAYVYVSYIQANGEVVHLQQPQGPVPSPLPANRALVFGDGAGGGPRFTVSPPLGEEMIIVLSAASPLFDAPRPQNETERDYLTAFRKALLYKPDAAAEARIVHADYLALTTTGKR